MSDRFFEEFEADKRALLAELRGEVGWPEYDEYERLAVDLMWRYIEALENAYTAERRVRRQITPPSLYSEPSEPAPRRADTIIHECGDDCG